MTMHRMSVGGRAPVPTARTETAESHGVGRYVATFLVALAGLLLVAAFFGDWGWSWLLWIVVGAASGSIGRSGRGVLSAWLAVAAFYASAMWLGLIVQLGRFWILGALVGALLLGGGYAIGTLVRWRNPAEGARAWWRSLSRVGRRSFIVLIAAGLLGSGVYTGYVGYVGSAELIDAGKAYPHCWTPDVRYGWSYEAINYDKADDARLAAANPGMEFCSTPPSAGDEVVSSDGVRLAGWYIPAASDIGPTGPTLVIAPGWTSSKSEVLKYAPPFHDAFNLVLVDLRDQGRSDRAPISWGVNERHDVRAMVDWLVERKHPSWIGAMGNSMGAISVLAAAVDDPRIEALILDSMQASIVAAVGQGLEQENNQPAVPGSWAAVAGLSLRLGTDVTQVDPVRTIVRVGDRPVLLIHGTADILDVPAQASEPNFHAALDAGVPVELQYCRGGSHGQLIEACPDEWARWARSFLEGVMG